MGLLLITHDLAVVAGMAQRVALMYAGQIIEVAPADEFFAAPQHPYARALLRAARCRPARPAAGGDRRHGAAADEPSRGCRFAPRCSLALAALHDAAPELSMPVTAPGALPAACAGGRVPAPARVERAPPVAARAAARGPAGRARRCCRCRG